MAEGDQPSYQSGQLLQTATTIAAIAIALATFMNKKGPQQDGYYLIPLTLLVAGLFATAGSLYAMHDLKNELNQRSSAPDWFFLVQSGLYITGAAYVWIMIDNVP